MDHIACLPYARLRFSRQGSLISENDLDEAIAMSRESNATDLLVVSHGWNNDMEEAHRLYQNFFERVCHQQRTSQTLAPKLAMHRLAVIGVLWPSKKFADAEVIPGGVAGIESASVDEKIAAQLDALVVDATAEEKAAVEKIRSSLNDLEKSAEARDLFLAALAGLMPSEEELRSELPRQGAGWNREIFVSLAESDTPSTTIDFEGGGLASSPGVPAFDFDEGTTAGLLDILKGAKETALRLLNFTTYYQMKERAGTVGIGLSHELRRIQGSLPGVRVHMIGHSFGGRVVASAANALAGESSVRLGSLTLLQTAFSHFGFAEKYDGHKDGYFRRVLSPKRIEGPILVSYTKNDTAVGYAYPIASRIAGQIAAGLGDASDKFGAIGRNGALLTPEANTETMILGPSDTRYSFEAGKLYNLNADDCITGHSDICKDEVANAVLTAVVGSN